MSKLVWDATGEHVYHTGTDHGVVYPISAAGTYPSGVAWNGLTAVTESPSGAEANDIYADNIKYLTLRSAEDFGFTIEAYTYPDEFAECDGSAYPTAGVRIGQQPRKAFGFCYRTLIGNDTEGDAHGYLLHLVWNATASPSERAYQTKNDSPEAVSFSWEATTIPINIEGYPDYKPVAFMEIDSRDFKETAAKTKLDTLLDALYGTDNADPYLPLPGAVIDMLKP